MNKIRLFSLIIVILLGTCGMIFGQYIEDCGMLEMGPEPGCVIFNADNYGRYDLRGDIEPFAIDDYVRIAGILDSGCISFCGGGDGCMDMESIAACEDTCDCMPGDCNGDGVHNIYDIGCLIMDMWLGGFPPYPYELCSGDANCDCVVNIFDVTFLISNLYLGGNDPCTCDDWLTACGPPLR